MKTENLSTLKIHKLSQEQYNREFDAGNIDPNAIYLTPWEASNVEIDIPKNEPLIVNLLKDGTTDKSTYEIITAAVSGKPVFGFWNNVYILPVGYDNDHVLFNMMLGGELTEFIVTENSYKMSLVSIPTKPGDIGAQPAGNYLTEVPEGYAKTEDIPTDDHINYLINTALGVIENGTY